MANELKGCPFCGGTARLTELAGALAPWPIVRCDDCDARTHPCTTDDLAIAAWNTRASPHLAPDVSELIERFTACPDINHARVVPIADRETEYVVPASVRFAVIAMLTHLSANREGEVGRIKEQVGRLVSILADRHDVFPDTASFIDALDEEICELYAGIEDGAFHSAPSRDDVLEEGIELLGQLLGADPAPKYSAARKTASDWWEAYDARQALEGTKP